MKHVVERSGDRRLSPTRKKNSALSQFPKKKEMMEKPGACWLKAVARVTSFGFAFFTADFLAVFFALLLESPAAPSPALRPLPGAPSPPGNWPCAPPRTRAQRCGRPGDCHGFCAERAVAHKLRQLHASRE